MRNRLTFNAREWCCAVLIAFALLPMPGSAADELYTAAAQVDPADPDARKLAYRNALNLVLVRVTGSGGEGHLLQLAEIFVDPDRFVLRHRPGPDGTLIVSFDGQAIERLLRQNRYTVWGGKRPVTLVWLAVDRGQGQREIVSADDERQTADSFRSVDRNRLLRERVDETAKRRGIAVIFPLLDTEDRQRLGFSDIWGGFDDRVIEASRRYGTSSILIGRVRVNSAQPGRWTHYSGGERLSWAGEPEQAVSQLADALAEQYAIRGDAVLNSYSLTVGGIDSIVAYGRVMQLMENLDAVEGFTLKTVAGQRVDYIVGMYGDIDRLSKALEFSGVVVPARVMDARDIQEGAMSDPDRLYFDFVPSEKALDSRSSEYGPGVSDSDVPKDSDPG